jgi:hypothetical protein
VPPLPVQSSSRYFGGDGSKLLGVGSGFLMLTGMGDSAVWAGTDDLACTSASAWVLLGSIFLGFHQRLEFLIGTDS